MLTDIGMIEFVPHQMSKRQTNIHALCGFTITPVCKHLNQTQTGLAALNVL